MRFSGDFGAAVVYDVRNLFEDGWCGPDVEFTVGANAEMTVLEFSAWTKADVRSQSSRLTIAINNLPSFDFEIPNGRVVQIQAACPLQAGDAAKVRIRSDHVLGNIGEDTRELSYIMKDLRFS